MRVTFVSVMMTIAIVVATIAASAQTKTIPGEAETITATVEAIDATTRTLTVYDNIVLRLKPAGEPAVDTTSDAVTKGSGASPAGTTATQRTITATIVAIDNSVPSITFKGEKVNWTYSSRVADKAALAKVKVGDRVDITWTEALTVSVTSPAKKE